MARVVDGGAGASSRVPWEQWADGQTWELRRGEDFEQDVVRARRAVVAWANRRGRTAHTSVVDADTLRVKISP